MLVAIVGFCLFGFVSGYYISSAGSPEMNEKTLKPLWVSIGISVFVLAAPSLWEMVPVGSGACKKAPSGEVMDGVSLECLDWCSKEGFKGFEGSGKSTIVDCQETCCQ